jgi:alpha-1,2-mannosyltransferase
VRFAQLTVRAADEHTSGFVAYYTAARLVREGGDVDQFYDDRWFEEQTRREDPHVSDVWGPNPPTATLLLLPLSWGSYHTARIAWTAISVASIAAAGAWLIRGERLPAALVPALIAFGLVFQPVWGTIALGQAYAFLTALLMLAWCGYRRDDERLIGIPLGLVLALKLSGLLLWPLLLLQRRWGALGWATATVVALALITVPFAGPDGWQTWFREADDLARPPGLSVTAYQSQAGFIQHMLRRDSYNPSPLLDVPGLAQPAQWVSAGALVAVSFLVVFRGRRPGLCVALVVLLGLILGPLSLDYHYTFALLAIALLAADAASWRSNIQLAAFLVGVVLIGADLPYRSARYADGAASFLAYPKLYGAWLLWAVSAWALLRGPRDAGQPGYESPAVSDSNAACA